MESTFVHKNSKLVGSTPAKTLPFGASLKQLKEEYDKIKHHIRYELVNNHFNDIQIRKLFFSNGVANSEECVVSSLGLSGILDYYNPRVSSILGYKDENPFLNDFTNPEWLGSCPGNQAKLICWFMGFRIPDENWVNADTLTEPKNGKPVKVFDLQSSIFSYIKYRFNEAISKDDKDDRIRSKHNFTCEVSLDSEGNEYTIINFDTVVFLRMYVSDFDSHNIATTIRKLDDNIAKEEEEEMKVIAAENAAFKLESHPKYVRRVKNFIVKVFAKAAEYNMVLTPLSDDLIDVYADFCFDAVHYQKTTLEDKEITCTLDIIRNDIMKNLGANVCSVENQMKNGSELVYEKAVKMIS
jgi:hypothetical protein